MKKRFCRWQRILDSWTLHCLQHRTGRAFRITAGRNSWNEKKAGCRINVEELYHPLTDTIRWQTVCMRRAEILLTGLECVGEKSTFM